MTIAFSMTKDSPLGGGLISFLLNWDLKTGKQSSGQRKLAALTRGKVNLGGKPKEADLDIGIALYRDKQPKRLVIGWNPDAVVGCGHSGDNQTGVGDDDENTWIDLDGIPAWVTEWAVILSTKPSGSFGDALNVGVKVFAGKAKEGPEVDELMPTLGANQNVSVVASGKRNKDGAGNILDGWTTRLVDASGRYVLQPGEDVDTSILRFAKANAGF